MAMDEARRAQLMAYCRLDALSDAENQLLDQLYEAAVGYMSEAGVPQPDAGTPRAAQYDLAVNAMVLDSWDARGSQVEKSALQDNPSWRRLVNQLKLTQF